MQRNDVAPMDQEPRSGPAPLLAAGSGRTLPKMGDLLWVLGLHHKHAEGVGLLKLLLTKGSQPIFFGV